MVGEGTVRSPRLEVQLKCTERDVLREDGVHFQLKRKNYDDLRDPDVMVPRILVVMLVPEDPSEWLNDVPEEEMCLRRCAWWMPLVGEDERLGVESPMVILPRQNLFNPDSNTTREIAEVRGQRKKNLEPLAISISLGPNRVLFGHDLLLSPTVESQVRSDVERLKSPHNLRDLNR